MGIRELGSWIWRLLFGCLHQQRTWVFSDEEGLYRRCLDCGARVAVVEGQVKKEIVFARRLS